MTPAQLFAAMDATWPAATTAQVGPWAIRDGQGGGKRVSAATAERDWQIADIDRAEAAMAALQQPALFLLRQGEAALDLVLADRGYRIVDPVIGYAASVQELAEIPPAPMTSFPHWPPMAIAEQLWAEGGIGPARLAVMQRAKGPKTAILGRAADRASGIGYVAIHGKIAMLHGLEVTPSLRRQGSAHNILRAAALWAQHHGANVLALVVTKANEAARRLYTSAGMTVVGQYHYRQK